MCVSVCAHAGIVQKQVLRFHYSNCMEPCLKAVGEKIYICRRFFFFFFFLVFFFFFFFLLVFYRFFFFFFFLIYIVFTKLTL